MPHRDVSSLFRLVTDLDLGFGVNPHPDQGTSAALMFKLAQIQQALNRVGLRSDEDGSTASPAFKTAPAPK